MAQEWASNLLQSTEACFSDTDIYLEQQIEVHMRESKLVIPIIHDLIKGKIEPESAAVALASICGDRITTGGDFTAPESIWKVFCSAVDHFGGDSKIRDRLVLLLVNLSKIEVLGSDGSPIQSNMNRDTFWRQLPGYSLGFRDEMTCVPSIDGFNNDAEFEDWKRRFENGNAFQAQWISQVGRDGPTREYKSAINIGLWHLRGALDPNIVDSPLGLRRLELWIPGAVQWILIAGNVVFNLCREKELNDGTPTNKHWLCDEGVDGYGFEGNEGFSLERWAFWKTKLRHVAGLKGVSVNISILADEAATKMEQTEKSTYL